MTNTYQNELEHNDALQLLPWHVQGALEGHEAQAMSTHVENCAECRQEARELNQVLTVAGQRSGEVDERRLDALMHRIEAFEQHRQSAASSDGQEPPLPGSRVRGMFHSWWQWMVDLLAMRPAIVPLGGVAAAVLAVVLVMPLADPPQTGEYTVHSSTPAAEAAGPTVRVVFGAPPQAQELDALSAQPGVAGIEARSATEYRLQLNPETGVAAISALVSELDRQPGVSAVSIENGTR